MKKLKKSLYKYINSPLDPIANMELGLEYEKIGQGAAALSFFLRAAEYSKYDEINMTKTNTFRYIKHINNDGKYKHSIITEESYKVPLTQRELKNRDYENLMNSINQEIASLKLDDYKSKEDILRFACELYPGKSSGEKYKRATLLNKAVINHMRGEKYNRRRITHFDISVY